MSTISTLSHVLRDALSTPAGGVVGLVDDLLSLCHEHGVDLDWRAGRCKVRSSNGQWEEVLDVSLRESVFRAILARVAVLCNERNPGSVLPYGGQGELSIRRNTNATLKVAFSNTASEQHLHLG